MIGSDDIPWPRYRNHNCAGADDSRRTMGATRLILTITPWAVLALLPTSRGLLPAAPLPGRRRMLPTRSLAARTAKKGGGFGAAAPKKAKGVAKAKATAPTKFVPLSSPAPAAAAAGGVERVLDSDDISELDGLPVFVLANAAGEPLQKEVASQHSQQRASARVERS